MQFIKKIIFFSFFLSYTETVITSNNQSSRLKSALGYAATINKQTKNKLPQLEIAQKTSPTTVFISANKGNEMTVEAWLYGQQEAHINKTRKKVQKNA